MKKFLVVLIILMLTIIPSVSAAEGNVALTEGTTSKDGTVVTLDAGNVTVEATDLTATTSTTINGTEFIPATTNSVGDELVWGTGEKQWFVFDDPTVSMAYQYSGKQLKETITLQSDKQLSFPITLGPDSKLIPWENGQWKVVSASSGDTMKGIVITKPFGIDAAGNHIDMDYTYDGSNLNLVYNRTITTYTYANLTDRFGTPTYSDITYPLTIDPTWVSVGGGAYSDTTSVPGYNITMWNTTGSTTWTVPSGVTNVSYLVVAGGGGGSYSLGGAGGAGGLRGSFDVTGGGGALESPLAVTPGNVIPVIVGAGGNHGASGTNDGGQGTASNFSTITTVGGAGGRGVSNGNGYTGGSGGGAIGTTISYSGGNGTANQGYNGGGANSGTDYQPGGGGGAGSIGATGVSGAAGNGGDGVQSSITGTATWYAGGGGAGKRISGTAGTGGSGIGGNGGFGVIGGNGTSNTGSGGGGGGTSLNGGDGGSGIVIIRYAVTSTPVSSFTSANISVVVNSTVQGWAGVSPLTMRFNDTSTGTPTSWNWSAIGHGTNSTTVNNWSTTQNTTATFTTGNFTILHGVGNAYGVNTSVQVTWINVSAPLTDPNPSSMIKFETATSNTQINNQTPYVGTVYIRNVSTGPTEVYGNITWDTSHVSVSNLRANTSVTAGIVLKSSSIGTGFANFDVTDASPISTPTSLVDFNITYTVYAAPGTIDAFSYASTGNEYNDTVNNTWWNFNQVVGANAVIGSWGPINSTFSANVTTVAVGAPIKFTDASTGYPDAWNWNFGDGGTSTSQNPVYSYAATGLKTVTLQAYLSENGSVTNTTVYTNYINVTAAPPPAPIVAFSGTPTTVTAGSSVQFTDASLNSPTSWTWVFGDGGGNSNQNPLHIYSSIGNYTVNLTATNAQGSNTLSKTNYISVVALAPPVANFTSNVSSGQFPLAVGFTDTSTNVPTSWSWNFGDTGVSSAQNPSHTFAAAGNYTVTLTAANAAGNTTKTEYILAQALSGFNQQDIWMAGEYTLTIHFTDANTGAAIPVVTVLDSNMVTVTTANATFIGSYPYSTIAETYSATGYSAKQISYIMDSNQEYTVQLTPVTVTTNSNTVWYVPKTVEFHVVDNAGNYLTGANVTGHFNSSTTLPGGLSNLLTFYGMNQNAANDAANGTLIMNGYADSMGNIVFTMLSTLNYDVYVTYGGVTNYYTIHPQSTNYELRFMGAAVPDYSLQTCLYANGHTYTSASSDYLGNFTMGFSYQDTCSKTTAIDYYVVLQNTGAQVYTYHQAPVTSGIYVLNYTVSNVRGNNYEWFENYTRSV